MNAGPGLRFIVTIEFLEREATVTKQASFMNFLFYCHKNSSFGVLSISVIQA